SPSSAGSASPEAVFCGGAACGPLSARRCVDRRGRCPAGRVACARREDTMTDAPDGGTAAGPRWRVLAEVAAVFLKLGLIGFGGPAAHMALMRDELVRRRGWVSDQRFLDLMGAVNFIPGPNSTELA